MSWEKIWGKTPAESEALMKALDRAKAQEHQAGGLTKDLAEYWKRLYANDLVRNPNNKAAAARQKFLEKYLELLK